MRFATSWRMRSSCQTPIRLDLCWCQMLPQIPIVFTIRGCSACTKLLEKWNAEGMEYDERRVELSQATLDEARRYGRLVPIVIWPDGLVEEGFGDSIGCLI